MEADSMARRSRVLALAALLCSACVAHRRAEWLIGKAPPARPVVQSLVGASLYERGDVVVDGVSTSDPGAFAVADYGTVPTVGVAGMQPLSGGPLHAGLESALLFSWWQKDADVLGGASSPPLQVRTRFWLTDLSVGAYASTSMNRTVRAYAGAGGAMLIGVFDTASNQIDDDPRDTAFAVGPYARAGVELLLGDGSLLGLGVRGVAAELDFSGGISDLDLGGVQVFLTYSLGTGPFFAPPAW
jgi:hypothetical protein